MLLAVLLIVGGVSLACGRPPGSKAESTPGGAQPSPSAGQPVPIVSSAPPANARQALSVQLKPGADPNAVAARLVGPRTFVQPAWRGAANPPIGPAARRTFLIPIAAGQEGTTLRKAQTDADVESVQLVPWPPDYP
jgi:hypothetical protein